MAKVINVVAECSNVGKTTLIEGLIKEIKGRGLTVATIKHDVHGFEIDHKGKDTYKHRKAGADTVIISSKERFAMIREVDEEIELETSISFVKDKDIVLVEGYKKSNLRKIEVFREGISSRIISKKENIIAIASKAPIKINDTVCIDNEDYKSIVDIILLENEYII